MLVETIPRLFKAGPLMQLAKATMKHCPKCSSLMPEDAIRCIRCGFGSDPKSKSEQSRKVESHVEAESHASIIRRVGIIVLAAGLVDIAVMVYCIVKQIAYSSSLNIFAVVAGLFLMRGNLRATAIVRWLAAFMLAALLCFVVAWPFLQPIDLTLTQIQLSPLLFATRGIHAILLLVLLFWVIRELGRQPVILAYQADGRKPPRILLPAAVGIGVVVAIAIFMKLLLGGETARQAINLATQQLGDDYKYHVSSLNIVKNGQGTFVSGVVTAWNKKEVRAVPVHWNE